MGTTIDEHNGSQPISAVDLTRLHVNVLGPRSILLGLFKTMKGEHKLSRCSVRSTVLEARTMKFEHDGLEN